MAMQVIDAATRKERVESYYKETMTDYEKYWHGNTLGLHVGYWNATTRTVLESIINENRLVATVAGISRDSHVLDAGCGIGGTSTWIASTVGATMTGITISPEQVEKARYHAKNRGVSGKTSFHVMDYEQTTFDDNTFDAVIMIESSCHATSKARLVLEMHRVMKPGGRLVVIDTFARKPRRAMTIAERMLVKAVEIGWSVPYFSSRKVFSRLLARQGFTGTRYYNITSNMTRSTLHMSVASMLGLGMDFMHWKLGAITRNQFINMAGCAAYHFTFKSACDLGMFVATKTRF